MIDARLSRAFVFVLLKDFLHALSSSQTAADQRYPVRFCGTRCGSAKRKDLAQRFQVSVGTVRRAVDELVAEHVLLRQQGRGTFVGKLDRERFMFQFLK